MDQKEKADMFTRLWVKLEAEFQAKPIHAQKAIVCLN